MWVPLGCDRGVCSDYPWDQVSGRVATASLHLLFLLCGRIKPKSTRCSPPFVSHKPGEIQRTSFCFFLMTGWNVCFSSDAAEMRQRPLSRVFPLNLTWANLWDSEVTGIRMKNKERLIASFQLNWPNPQPFRCGVTVLATAMPPTSPLHRLKLPWESGSIRQPISWHLCCILRRTSWKYVGRRHKMQQQVDLVKKTNKV